METLSYLFYIVPGDAAFSFFIWLGLLWAFMKVAALFVDIFSGPKED